MRVLLAEESGVAEDSLRAFRAEIHARIAATPLRRPVA